MANVHCVKRLVAERALAAAGSLYACSDGLPEALRAGTKHEQACAVSKVPVAARQGTSRRLLSTPGLVRVGARVWESAFIPLQPLLQLCQPAWGAGAAEPRRVRGLGGPRDPWDPYRLACQALAACACPFWWAAS